MPATIGASLPGPPPPPPPPGDDFGREVSVVIPTFNRAHVLPAAINSVLRQTLPVREIIVVDDGSTDNTREIVAAIPGPIRYFHQPNRGPAAARNHGMRVAHGSWIAFQDSDDLWVPDKVAVQTAFLRANPGVDFVFADLSNFSGDGDGEPDATDPAPEILDAPFHAYLRRHHTRLDGWFGHLLRTNPVPTPTVMFRRSCLEAVGWFDESLSCCEDYDLWLRFAWHCRCGFNDRVLVHRRIHATNLIHDYAVVYERMLTVLRNLPARLGTTAATSEGWEREIAAARTRTHFRLGSWYFGQRRWAEARDHLRQVHFGHLDPGFRARAFFVVKRLLSPLLSPFSLPPHPAISP